MVSFLLQSLLSFSERFFEQFWLFVPLFLQVWLIFLFYHVAVKFGFVAGFASDFAAAISFNIFLASPLPIEPLS